MNQQINMEAFRNGEEREFEKIVTMFNGKLSYFAMKITEDTHEAQDIAIESLFKAWVKCEDFGTIQELNAFLYITVRNACLNKLRGKKRRIRREKESALLLEDHVLMVELEMIDEGLIRELLVKAIESLPDSCRTVCKLRYIEGKSISEIMVMLDKERKNITTQLHTGRQKIKEFMAAQNNHPR